MKDFTIEQAEQTDVHAINNSLTCIAYFIINKKAMYRVPSISKRRMTQKGFRYLYSQIGERRNPWLYAIVSIIFFYHEKDFGC